MSDSTEASPSPPPPPFVEPYPGFSDETNGPLIVVVTTALTGLATLFVIARVYSRMLSAGKIALDDWIIIISVVIMPVPSMCTTLHRFLRRYPSQHTHTHTHIPRYTYI